MGGCPGGFPPLHPRLGGCRLYPARLILTLASLQPVHAILAVAWAPRRQAVPGAPQRSWLGRQNAIVPPENSKAAEGRDGAGAICLERGAPPPHASLGNPSLPPPGTVSWRGAGAGDEGLILAPVLADMGGEVVQHIPQLCLPPSCPVAIAVGREEGRGDLGGGGHEERGGLATEATCLHQQRAEHHYGNAF